MCAGTFQPQTGYLQPRSVFNGRERGFLYPAIIVSTFGVGAMEIAYAEAEEVRLLPLMISHLDSRRLSLLFLQDIWWSILAT